MISEFMKYWWVTVAALAVCVFCLLYLLVSYAETRGYADGYCSALGGETFSNTEFCIINDELVKMK